MDEIKKFVQSFNIDLYDERQMSYTLSDDIYITFHSQ